MNYPNDLYDELQVSKNATFEDIKRAYKKLALKYHPDKCGNEHIDTFNKIHNAYHILSDPEKRKKYDLTISKKSLEGYSELFQKLFCIFINLIIKNDQKPTSTIDVRNLNIEIDVDLSEIYHKVIKKVCIKVRRFQNHKEFYETIPLYLSLLNYKKQYTYTNMGDEYLVDNSIIKTDVTLTVNIKEHPFINIDNIMSQYDLHIQKEITLYEYYFGYSERIDYFGSPLDIKYDGKPMSFESGTYFYVVVTEKGLGLPYFDNDDNTEKRGDLYIFFSIKLPKMYNDNYNFEKFLKEFFN